MGENDALYVSMSPNGITEKDILTGKLRVVSPRSSLSFLHSFPVALSFRALGLHGDTI